MSRKKIICFDQYKKAYLFEDSEFIPREAAYGFHFKDNSILLVKDILSGNWEIPGGGKENDEDDLSCLKREFFEETGLMINNGIQFYTQETSYFYDINTNEPWKTLKKYFIISSTKGIVRKNGNNDDISQAKYISKNNLNNIPIQKTTHDLINKLLTYFS